MAFLHLVRRYELTQEQKEGLSSFIYATTMFLVLSFLHWKNENGILILASELNEKLGEKHHVIEMLFKC